MLNELLQRNRSYRRFDQSVAVSRDTLEGLVNLTRYAATSGNVQPLKYMLCHTPEKNAILFENLLWAYYLTDWPGPPEGQRPTGYIVVLGDTSIRPEGNWAHDAGIAVQTILLGAVEQGLGGCIFASAKKKPLREALKIPDHLEIELVVAIGKPIETIQLDSIGPDGSIEYWRDPQGIHHVPKRALNELIVD